MIIRERHYETCVCVCWCGLNTKIYIFIKVLYLNKFVRIWMDIPVLINIYLNDMHTKYEYRIHDKNL